MNRVMVEMGDNQLMRRGVETTNDRERRFISPKRGKSKFLATLPESLHPNISIERKPANGVTVFVTNAETQEVVEQTLTDAGFKEVRRPQLEPGVKLPDPYTFPSRYTKHGT